LIKTDKASREVYIINPKLGVTVDSLNIGQPLQKWRQFNEAMSVSRIFNSTRLASEICQFLTYWRNSVYLACSIFFSSRNNLIKSHSLNFVANGHSRNGLASLKNMTGVDYKRLQWKDVSSPRKKHKKLCKKFRGHIHNNSFSS